MSGGIYSALSGMGARLEELDRIAADLANVGTAGYKSERVSTASSSQEGFESTLESAIDVVASESKTDFRPGTIASTGRSLDVAIDGRAFFVIETPAGERYTRSGGFHRGTEGRLTTAQGEPVLGEGGEITLGTGLVSIDETGTVRSGATVVGTLQLVEFAETDLVRESGTRFRAADGAFSEPSESTLVPGALEQSNVSVIDRMVALTEVSRNFESMERAVSVLTNDLDSTAIVELGQG